MHMQDNNWVLSQLLQHIPSFGAGKPLSLCPFRESEPRPVSPWVSQEGASAGGNPHLSLPQDSKGEVRE